MIISEGISLIMVITVDWKSLKPEDELDDDLLPVEQESAKNRKDYVSVSDGKI